MVEHVGQGCGLSFLIVAVFAVLLHERETAPLPVAKPEATAVAVDPSKSTTPPATRSPLVVTTPPAAEASTPPATKLLVPLEQTAPLPTPTPKVVAVAPPRSTAPRVAANPPHRPQPRPEPRNPDSDFTQVGVGETMESIAIRVYGSSESVETLWRSNRDQVVTKGRPLEPGAWLRTPPCPAPQARPGRR